MKIAIAVIVLCALQNSLVLGRTPDEVIEEFKPLILELHNVLARESFKFVIYYPNEYQEAVQNLDNNMIEGFNSNLRFIEQKVREIVAEYNMTSHYDQIKHCYAQKDTDKLRLIETAEAGRQVCKKLVDIDNEHFQTFLHDNQQKQQPAHNALERSVDTCKSNTDTGLDMASCLIENLLGWLAPQVGKFLKDVRTDTFDIATIVRERLNRISPCFNFVGENSVEVTKKAIDGFRKCVVASLNN